MQQILGRRAHIDPDPNRERQHHHVAGGEAGHAGGAQQIAFFRVAGLRQARRVERHQPEAKPCRQRHQRVGARGLSTPAQDQSAGGEIRARVDHIGFARIEALYKPHASGTSQAVYHEMERARAVWLPHRSAREIMRGRVRVGLDAGADTARIEGFEPESAHGFERARAARAAEARTRRHRLRAMRARGARTRLDRGVERRHQRTKKRWVSCARSPAAPAAITRTSHWPDTGSSMRVA
jgi:hypothetical protein